MPVGAIALVALERSVPGVVGLRGAFLPVLVGLVALQDTVHDAAIVQMRAAEPVREVLGEAVVPLVVARFLGNLLAFFLCVHATRGQRVDAQVVLQGHRVGQGASANRALKRSDLVRFLVIG